MEYTLASAAKAVGLGKTTLHTAIKRGRLSARRLEDGSYRIDGAELARVYPPVPAERPEPSPWNKAEQIRTETEWVGTAPDAVGTELAVLRVKLEAAEAKIADMGRERETILETVDDLRKRLDKSEERVLAITTAAVQRPAPELPQVAEDLRKRLDKAEERIVALAAPERPQERPVEASAGMTAAKPSRGFLARLLGL